MNQYTAYEIRQILGMTSIPLQTLSDDMVLRIDKHARSLHPKTDQEYRQKAIEFYCYEIAPFIK